MCVCLTVCEIPQKHSQWELPLTQFKQTQNSRQDFAFSKQRTNRKILLGKYTTTIGMYPTVPHSPIL